MVRDLFHRKVWEGIDWCVYLCSDERCVVEDQGREVMYNLMYCTLSPPSILNLRIHHSRESMKTDGRRPHIEYDLRVNVCRSSLKS